MTPDLDLCRTAASLVKQHGSDAQIEAAMRAANLLDKGDMEGHAVWKRIRRAVFWRARHPAGMEGWTTLSGVTKFHPWQGEGAR